MVLGVKTPDWNRRQQLRFRKCGWLSACLPVSLSPAGRQAGSRSVSRWKPLRVAAAAALRRNTNPLGRKKLCASEHKTRNINFKSPAAPIVWRRGSEVEIYIQTSNKQAIRGGGEKKKLPELTETESPDNPVNRVLRRSALIFQLSVSSSSSSSSEEEDWFEAVRTENELFGPLIICGLWLRL